jgi:hypothetical protein
MITNNTEFLQMVILSMAEQKYEEDIVQKFMETTTIGKGLDYESKECWISDFITEHFNLVKESIIEKNGKEGTSKIFEYSNTLAMRLYSLDMAQTFELDNFTKITRFPGGWCLQTSASNMNRQVFIPFNKEFSISDGILKREFDRITVNENITVKENVDDKLLKEVTNLNAQ